MGTCPVCQADLVSERLRISKGVFARVEVCPACRPELPEDGGQEALRRLFLRRAFRMGGSLAVQMPMPRARPLGIRAGTLMNTRVPERGILLEPGKESAR